MCKSGSSRDDGARVERLGGECFAIAQPRIPEQRLDLSSVMRDSGICALTLEADYCVLPRLPVCPSILYDTSTAYFLEQSATFRERPKVKDSSKKASVSSLIQDDSFALQTLWSASQPRFHKRSII